MHVVHLLMSFAFYWFGIMYVKMAIFFKNNYGFNRPYFANSYSTHFPVLTDPRQLVHLPGIRVVTHVVARDEIGPKRTNDFSLGHSER